jgi:hypothetical protein
MAIQKDKGKGLSLYLSMLHWRRSPDLCLIITFFADVSVVALGINTEKRYIVLKLTMSTKYKFMDTAATYFAISTVVDWIYLPAGRQVYLQEKITKQYCWIVFGIASKTRVCRFAPGY